MPLSGIGKEPQSLNRQHHARAVPRSVTVIPQSTNPAAR